MPDASPILAILLAVSIAGCGYAPRPAPKIYTPPPAAPEVQKIAAPLAEVSKANTQAQAAVTAIPTRPPAAVAAAKQRTQAILVTQAGYLRAAEKQVAVAIPAARAADAAAKHNGAAAAVWRSKYSRLRQRQVQMALTWGTIAGGLFVLGGILLAVFTSGKIEGVALSFCGALLVAAVWLAAAHLLLVEIAAGCAPVVFGIWMFCGRHHEHVLRVKAAVAPAAAGK